MKVKEAQRLGVNTLKEVFGENSELGNNREVTSNVNILLATVLKLNINELKIKQNMELNFEQEKLFTKFLARRMEMEPVQYITGETEFWSLPIYVGKGVLIPRQDTETLVSKVKDLFPDTKANYIFLDICCGTGCIGLALLSIYPNAKVCFIDKFSTPLEYTKKNLNRLGFTNRAEIIQSDMFSKLSTNKKFDAIVSNPPYIPEQELKSISMQITLFEPSEALRAGDSGLSFYETFAKEAVKFLTPQGLLFLEIAQKQGQDVLEIFNKNTWSKTQIFKDLAKNDRVLVTKKINVI